MTTPEIDDVLDIHLESAEIPGGRLRVRELSGREAIGRPYTFDLLVTCDDDAGVDLDVVAGAEATIVFEVSGREVRRVHGIVVEADDHLADVAEAREYRLRLAPRAHRMEMIRTCEVFVDASVPDVIRQKIERVGLESGAVLRLLGEYAPREIVVQYDETDLAFVRRLAEHLGVSLFFEAHGGADALVFTDHAAGFRPIPGAEVVLFRGRGAARDVFSLRTERRIVPGFYAVRDYDYKNPVLDLTADRDLPTGHPGGVIEHGSNHKTPWEGAAIATARAEEQESARLVHVGKSDRCELTAGARFRLEGHPQLDALDLLVVEVEHEARRGAHGHAPLYRNTFRATPAGQPYRPPRVTPRQRIGGLVTGIIDGALTGGALYAPIDNQGRYRVQFLFDTAPLGARPVSCPVRMLQNFVGENYGTHFPLRAGAEVLVGFVNGDPDRPVIVGAVPNPLKPSPVSGKDPIAHRMKTASGIKIEIVDEP